MRCDVSAPVYVDLISVSTGILLLFLPVPAASKSKSHQHFGAGNGKRKPHIGDGISDMLRILYKYIGHLTMDYGYLSDTPQLPTAKPKKGGTTMKFIKYEYGHQSVCV